MVNLNSFFFILYLAGRKNAEMTMLNSFMSQRHYRNEKLKFENPF